MRVAAVLGLALSLLLASVAEARPRRPRGGRAAPEPTVEAPPEETTPPPSEAETAATPQPQTSPQPQPEPRPSTPAARTEAPQEGPALDFQDPSTIPDLSSVRDEIDAIMDELVETRARVAAVGRELFDTRIRIRVYLGATRLEGGVSVSVRLDGLAVYAAEPGSGSEGTQIFEGYAAPGPHVLQITAERRARADDDYRATQAETLRFELTRGKMHDVAVILEDRSNIATSLPSRGEGYFDLRTRVRVQTIDIERATR